MIILSIFGTARGLEVVDLYTPKDPIPFQLENQWLEISLNEVALQPNIDTVFINRRMIAGNTLTWIGVYQHVFEMGYQRQGSFLGAGVWLINSTISADILLPILKHIAQQLKDKATNQIQFVKRIEEVKNDFIFNPSDLTSQEIGISHGLSSIADAGFFAPKDHASDFQEVINWAQNARGADLFNRGYISPQETYVNPATGSSNKLVMLHNSATVDVFYAKKIIELSEQINQQNHQINQLNHQIQQTEQQLKMSLQDIEQLKIQNNQLRQESHNHKGDMDRQRNEFQRQIQQALSAKTQRVNETTKTIPPNNSSSNQGSNLVKIMFFLVVTNIVSGVLGYWAGDHLNDQKVSSQPNKNTTIPTPKSNPTPTQTYENNSLVEDVSCKELKLNTFTLTIGSTDLPKSEELTSDTLAQKTLQNVCKSLKSFEKFSSCKIQYKEFVNSIEKIKSQTIMKGEIKLPDYCLQPDLKGYLNKSFNNTSITLTALPNNTKISPNNSTSNKPDKPNNLDTSNK